MIPAIGRHRSSGSGDPYWNNVAFLLHGNGVNGGTVITDQKGGIWSAQGALVTSTAQSKFNGSSLAFNGVNSTYINSPSNIAYHRGSSDFTAECWAYFNSVGGNQTLLQIQIDSGHSGYAEISITVSSGVLYFLLETSAGAWTYSSGGTISAGLWYFIAVQVKGTTATAYINGVAAFTFSVGASVSNSGQNIIGNSQINQPFNGYMAEIRYTLGVARYSGNFTPPTAPFPNSM